MKKIYIAGYPRSGNVWLARCLSDMYDCSIMATEGRESIAQRTGSNESVLIIQDHFVTSDNGVFVDGLSINPALKTPDSEIIFMYRNPFDVAVSVSKYWGIERACDALTVLSKGEKIVSVDWRNYTLQWIEQMEYLTAIVTYEEMRRNTMATLVYLRNVLKIREKMSVVDIVRNNDIEKTRERIAQNPSQFSYHQGIQMKHVRKGVVGDWHNHKAIRDLNELWYKDK